MLRINTSGGERIGSRDLTEWRSGFGRWLATVALALGGWLARTVLRTARWSAANAVLVLTAGIGLLVTVSLSAVTAEVYEAVVERDGIAGLDRPVLDQAVEWRSPAVDEVVTTFTDLGGSVWMPVLAAIAVLAMTLAWRSLTPVGLMLVAAGGSLAMTAAGKSLAGRLRPPLDLAVPPFEQSPSFPSGHTLNATVIAGIVVYLLLRRLDRKRTRLATIALGALFVGAMGLSRVFLGHHWLTDVIAGWLLGLAWVAVVITAHRLFLTVRKARREAV